MCYGCITLAFDERIERQMQEEDLEMLIPDDEDEGYNRQTMAEENERQMEAEQSKQIQTKNGLNKSNFYFTNKMSAFIDPYKALDEFFKPYEWNFNLPKFISSFFDQDRTWVAGALKAVLPAGRLTDEEISEVAYSLWGYAQHHTLDLDKARSRQIMVDQSVQTLCFIEDTD